MRLNTHTHRIPDWKRYRLHKLIKPICRIIFKDKLGIICIDTSTYPQLTESERSVLEILVQGGYSVQLEISSQKSLK